MKPGPYNIPSDVGKLLGADGMLDEGNRKDVRFGVEDFAVEDGRFGQFGFPQESGEFLVSLLVSRSFAAVQNFILVPLISPRTMKMKMNSLQQTPSYSGIRTLQKGAKETEKTLPGLRTLQKGAKETEKASEKARRKRAHRGGRIRTEDQKDRRRQRAFRAVGTLVERAGDAAGGEGAKWCAGRGILSNPIRLADGLVAVGRVLWVRQAVGGGGRRTKKLVGKPQFVFSTRKQKHLLLHNESIPAIRFSRWVLRVIGGL